MNDDDRAVYARLKGWAAKIAELQRLYAGQNYIPAANVERAREMYRIIKDGLRAEYARDSSSQRRPPLTESERQWYQHTVHGALGALRAPINSTTEKWFGGLYDAHSEFTHMISQMRSFFGLEDE